MSTSDCSCRSTCTTAALIISIAVGIIAAFLRITAAITLTPAFLWTVFGIAVVYLGVMLLASTTLRCCCANTPCCIRTAMAIQLGAIIATILLAGVLLAVEFAATSLLGAVLTGLLLFAFFLTLTETACLTRCILTNKD